MSNPFAKHMRQAAAACRDLDRSSKKVKKSHNGCQACTMLAAAIDLAHAIARAHHQAILDLRKES